MEILELPPAMITDLAMGNSDPIAIVKKYDYTFEDYMKMATYDWFHRAVAERKTQLESEGFTAKIKFGAMAEDLLANAYRAAVVSDSVAIKLDVAKYLSKISGLEPQPGIQAVGGAGFSVTFNFNGSPPVTIEGVPNAQEERTTSRSDIEDIRVVDSNLPGREPGILDALALPVSVWENNTDLDDGSDQAESAVVRV